MYWALERTDGQTKPERLYSYICDFSRGVLNARLCAHIQHLLRGHKYALFIFWSSVCWQPGKAKESIVGLLEELLSRTAKKFIVVEQS